MCSSAMCEADVEDTGAPDSTIRDVKEPTAAHSVSDAQPST